MKDILRHPELVTINGVTVDRNQYVFVGQTINFRQAPDTEDLISVNMDGSCLVFKGNGFQNVFNLHMNISPILFNHFMEDVWQKRDNPAVKDLLHQLEMTMELLR